MQCGRLKQPKEGDSKENFFQEQTVRGRECFYPNYMTKKCQSIHTYNIPKQILNKGRISQKNQPFSILMLHSLLFLMPPHADL